MTDPGDALAGGARDDLLVAGVAAGSAVALSLVLRIGLDLRVGALPRIAPVAVYPLYLLLGTGDTGSALEDPRPWAAGSVLVGVAVLAAALAG